MTFTKLAYKVFLCLIVTAYLCCTKTSITLAQDTTVGVTCPEVSYTPTPILEVNPNEPVVISPPNADGPTVANIGLYIIEISNIDVNANSYAMTAYLDLQWCDPRLAFTNSNKPKQYLNHIAQGKLETIWWPDVNFSNELHPREIEDEELVIAPDGTVDYREKFAVDLANNYDLKKFPFDSQHLTAKIESFEWTSEQLVLHVEDNIVGFSEEFSIPQWKITNVKEELTTKQEIRDRAPFSEVDIVITMQRDPGYYVTKVILPLLVIVGLTLLVLWLSPEDTKDRVELIFTGVLTSVAYQFVIAGNLPNYVYNTLIDAFIGWSFIVMVVAILETMTAGFMVRRDRLAQAKSLDRTARIVLPALYIIGTLLLIFIYTGS